MLTDGESSSQSAPSDRFERLLRLAARTSLSLPREETLATLLRLWEAAEAAEKPALLQRALLLATCDVALRPLAAALLRELVLEGAAEYVARDGKNGGEESECERFGGWSGWEWFIE